MSQIGGGSLNFRPAIGEMNFNVSYIFPKKGKVKKRKNFQFDVKVEIFLT